MTIRKLPTFVAALFLSVTLWRVALLVSHTLKAGYAGWPYSIGLGLAVYASGYFIRQNTNSQDKKLIKRDQQARVSAFVALLFFVAIDGIFNLVETLETVGDASQRVLFTAWLYGLFPTVAAALLGIMQGYIDRLPHGNRKPNEFLAKLGMVANLYADGWIAKAKASKRNNKEVRSRSKVNEPETEPKRIETAISEPEQTSAFVCPFCKREFDSQNGLNPHIGRCKSKPKAV